MIDIDMFLNCSVLSCLWEMRDELEEQALCGDPNAQFTLSFLYTE